MSGQGFKVLKVSERFYEGLFFYRHPKVLLKRHSVSTGHLQTVVPPNVAVDRNAPAARQWKAVTTSLQFSQPRNRVY